VFDSRVDDLNVGGRVPMKANKRHGGEQQAGWGGYLCAFRWISDAGRCN
jgi:hypothetical protein